MYDHRYTPIFKDCVQRYEARRDVLAALTETLTELAIQPFGNPRLQTHLVKKAQPETFTSYVTNQGHRLIWRRVGNVIVLLLFGEHDAVYRRAERLRLEIDDSQNVLRVVDQDPGTGDPVPYVKRRSDEGRLFMAWSDADLANFGFQPQEIPVLRRLNNDQDLLSLEDRMRAEAWQTAMNLVMYGRPTEEPPAAEPEDESAAIDLPDEVDVRVSEALADPARSQEFVPVPADKLAEILARPIEDWMVYLDPAQQDLVDRSYNGPARIRGAAGTGKTVVALHRARRLAEQGRRVLFTTYVRNLPEVYQQIFRRFAPDCRDRVEFKGVHRWALRYLHTHRIHVRLDLKAVDRAWKTAHQAVVTDQSPLKRAGLSTAYLREEVEWVIRGRALPDLDTYLTLERIGRGTPLPRDLRIDMWRLAEAYTKELDDTGVCDFNDVLRRAFEVVSEHQDAGYDAVIVDEAQDLTEMALRLLHALVGDRPDGLLLVGDGQQTIYPGGFNLSALGLQVRGRSHVLTRNYRNTREIYAAAQAVADQDRATVALEGGQYTIELSRSGATPEVGGYPSIEDHDLALAAAVEAALDAGTGLGDIALLVPTHALASHYTEIVADLGLPTQPLQDYDGTPSIALKVGTYQRAKGLEFKRVFMPRLDANGLNEARRQGEDDDAYAERLRLVRRQLFVAMTRARDELWLGWVGEPSSLLPASLTDTSPQPHQAE